MSLITPAFLSLHTPVLRFSIRCPLIKARASNVIGVQTSQINGVRRSNPRHFHAVLSPLEAICYSRRHHQSATRTTADEN